MKGAITIPSGPLSVEVEFKAKPSAPIAPSPSPEGTIGDAILPPNYSSVQHVTWNQLYDRQAEILDGRVCQEYLDGRKILNLSRTRVPELRAASLGLQKTTGWNVIRVNGYVPEPVFFKILANKCFPCTDFVRHPDELEYTPAPDMFHDLMGHLPMLTNKRFASFFHSFGLAGVNAKTDEEIAWLGRIYWFTVEFGLINPTAHKGDKRDPKQCRIYGSGIASSVGEITHSLSDKVKKHPFNIDVIAAREFDIHHMQPELFEISSFEELESEFKRWAVGKGLLPA